MDVDGLYSIRFSIWNGKNVAQALELVNLMTFSEHLKKKWFARQNQEQLTLHRQVITKINFLIS